MMQLGRDFALFFVATTLSAIGTAAVPVALSFALLEAGRSAAALGTVLAAQAIPTVALLLFTGVLGDRWPRRRIMVYADLLCFGAQSLLALVLIHGNAGLPTIVALTALVGAGIAFFYPARSGLIAQLVPEQQLERANSALSAAAAIAAIIGPALAGIVVATVGAGWAIGLDALSYVVSAVCLAFVRQRGDAATHPLERRSVVQDLRLGLGAFSSRRWLWLIVAQFGLLNLVAFGPLLVLAPVLLAQSPHGAQHWGFLLSSCGLGGLVGAVAIMRWQPVRAGLAVEMAIMLLVTPLLLLAFKAPLPALLTGGVAYGAGEAVVNVLIASLIQRNVSQQLLSRVFSIVQIAAGVLAPAGYALAGPAAHGLGLRHALLASAGLSLASVVALLCAAEVRDLRSDRSPGERADEPMPTPTASRLPG